MAPNTQSARMCKVHKTETDIAILQVQVKNIEDRVGAINNQIRDVVHTIDGNHNAVEAMLKGMKTDNEVGYGKLSEKITALEKWRWMMMGAGIVIGSLGFETLSKFIR